MWGVGCGVWGGGCTESRTPVRVWPLASHEYVSSGTEACPEVYGLAFGVQSSGVINMSTCYIICVYICTYIYLCVCVCVWERESERERVCVCTRESVCVCACVREGCWGYLAEAVVPPAHALARTRHPARVEPARGHFGAARALDHGCGALARGGGAERAAHAPCLAGFRLVLAHGAHRAARGRVLRDHVVQPRGRAPPERAEGEASR